MQCHCVWSQASRTFGLSKGGVGALTLPMKREREDEYMQHLAHVLSQGVPAQKQPWEVGPIMGARSMLPELLPKHRRQVLVQVTAAASAQVVQPHPVEAMLASVPAAPRPPSKRVLPWKVARDMDRRAALAKWERMLWPYMEHFPPLLAFHKDCEAGRAVPLEVCLEDIFAGKATATLHARAGPLVRFVKFCKDRCEFPFPLTESCVYTFLDALREQCAATFPQSFLHTVAFMKFVLGLVIEVDVLGPRVKGLAKRKYLEKRALVQRPALKAAMVLALEHIVLGRGSYTAADRVAAGFFLFLIFGRARHSDGQAAGELEFEHQGEGSSFEGYVEARIERSKTSYTLERKTRFLPIVALMQGLADKPWGLVWSQLLKDAGPKLGRGMPLLPAFTEGGVWLEAPAKPAYSAKWLRNLLYRQGFEIGLVKPLGTHSCKATALSWCAKYGIPRGVRSLLGYHSQGKGAGNTDLVYGRDNQAEPLRQLQKVVRAIAAGNFDPDALRSGYFKDGSAPQPEEPLSDSSTEASADEEDADHEGEEGAMDSLDAWEPRAGLAGELAGRELFRHGISRVIHLVDSEEGTHFVCRRVISTSYTSCARMPKILHPLCKQCFPTVA